MFECPQIKALDNELRQFQAQLKRAKGASATNIKRRAMQVLKRKKMYEQQRDQLAGQAFNLEQTNFAIETAQSTVDTVEAMKGAAATLKVEQKKINIDKVEDIQDELADMMWDMNEIQETLGRSYGVPDEFDEADLDDEFAALEDEWDQEDETQVESTPSYLQPAAPPALPAAPAAGLPANATGEAVDEYGLPVATPAAPAPGVALS